MYTENSRPKTYDEAATIVMSVTGTRSGEVPSKRTIKRWIDIAKDRACTDLIDRNVMTLVIKYALNYSNRFSQS